MAADSTTNLALNLDIIIVASFLLATLAVGLGQGRKVKTIQDYALGGRNFSTAAIVATVVATWASGSGFFITLQETYSRGFYDFIATLGIALSAILIGVFMVPRMGEFLGKLSIAEAMGDLYGTRVRIITAIAGTLGCSGFLAMQFKVFGNLVNYFTMTSAEISIIVAGVITTIYSAFGGIRAVTFTDLLQAFAFCFIIPLIGFLIWDDFFDQGYSIAGVIRQHPDFNFAYIFNINNPYLGGTLIMFIYFAIPLFIPATFQRVAIGTNLNQLRRVFLLVGVIYIFIEISSVWIPFLLKGIYPGLEAKQLLSHIINNYTYLGLKGLIAVAIIAFTMSSADSVINSAAVMLTHDIYAVVKKNVTNELFVSRVCALALGGSALYMALIETDLLSIIVMANSFYYPLVTPAFFLAVFGFRSSGKSVLVGMAAGALATIICQYILFADSHVSYKMLGVMVAMAANAAALIFTHYVFDQHGGWVGIRDRSYFIAKERLERLKAYRTMHAPIETWTTIWRKAAPKDNTQYCMMGLYFIIGTLTTMYATKNELLGAHEFIMKFVYPLMLLSGTLMISYPIWPVSIDRELKELLIEVWWPIAIFYMLILLSSFFVLISHFSTLQVALFSANLLISAMLLGWRVTFFLIPIGIIGSNWMYKFIFGAEGVSFELSSPDMIVYYIMLVVGMLVIFFVRPQERRYANSVTYLNNKELAIENQKKHMNKLTAKIQDMEEDITLYNQRIWHQQLEISRLGKTAQRILNNINHELRLPVGNVMNFAEMLAEGLGKYNEEQIKELSQEVYKNSTRLSTMILNMLDLAALSANELKLRLHIVNFGEMVKDRAQHCFKVYAKEKDLQLELKIIDNLLVKVDPNYIRQVIDNLVINAINFSDKGTILVEITRYANNMVLFTITDEGIGIPQAELYDIFTPFKMGSNTESKSEGRGVGLALCKAAVEAHKGAIRAESRGDSENAGAIFKFCLPLFLYTQDKEKEKDEEQ